MSETVQIEDPSTVINVLSDRVKSLERALERQAKEHRDELPEQFATLLRWMRARGVIPLYVGKIPAEKSMKDFVGGDRSLVSDETAIRALEQVWFLENAPVPEEVKTALRNAANNGMSRW